MKKVIAGLFATAAVLACGSASAQGNWPSKQIRVVVPFAAGAATDIVARTVLEQLSRQLGQSMIVENKPGAGGTIGAASVAQAEPDGYTLLVHSNSHTVARATYKSLSYDPQSDFVGVIPLAAVPMVMVTSPQNGAKTLADFVKAGKAKPGAMNYASAGTGGATHLGAERFLSSAGFTAVHIPTKSTAEALTEVITGRVDFYFAPVGFALPHVKADKVVALGVSSSQRSAAMPDVPTTLEAGLANSDYNVWIAMLAPAKTPKAIIERLNAETAKAIRSDAVKEKFKTLVMDEMIMSADNFNTFLAADFKTNADLVTKAKIPLN
jgi:tripartite-type tricarboxylate transporter receptor subunit TctC